MTPSNGEHPKERKIKERRTPGEKSSLGKMGTGFLLWFNQNGHGRSYGFGDGAKPNKASKRPLTQASLRCKRWLKPSSLHRIPTPLKRCWISHLRA